MTETLVSSFRAEQKPSYDIFDRGEKSHPDMRFRWKTEMNGVTGESFSDSEESARKDIADFWFNYPIQPSELDTHATERLEAEIRELKFQIGNLHVDVANAQQEAEHYKNALFTVADMLEVASDTIAQSEVTIGALTLIENYISKRRVYQSASDIPF